MFPGPTKESFCLKQRRNLKDVDDSLNNYETKLHAVEEILDDNVCSCRPCYAADLYHWVTNSAKSTGLCQSKMISRLQFLLTEETVRL